jgi:hypothetical protein
MRSSLAKIARTTALLMLLAFGVGIFLWLFRGSERSYSGKPLTYWCDQLAFTYSFGMPQSNSWKAVGFPRPRRARSRAEVAKDNNLHEKALNAIRAAGSNAAPVLLARLQRKPSVLEVRSRTLLIQLHLRPTPPVPIRDAERMQALTAILYLREPFLIPGLTTMTNSHDQWVRDASAFAISYIENQDLRNRLDRDINRTLSERIESGFYQ